MQIQEDPANSETAGLVSSNRNSIVIPEDDVVRTATVGSSVFNLTNTILGAGLLAVPWAFSKSGIIPAIILFFFAAFITQLGCNLLVKCSQIMHKKQIKLTPTGTIIFDTMNQFPTEPLVEPSYSTAARFSHPLLQYYCDFLVVIQTFGILTAYLIVVGDLIPEVFDDFSDGGSDAWYEGRRAWITVALIILSPICLFMKRLDSVKFTSIFALGTILYIVASVISYFFQHVNDDRDVKLVDWSLDIFSSFTVIVFSFGCHLNIMPIYHELKNPTPFRIGAVMNLSILSAMTTYLLVGIFAYLVFGSDTDSDVLTNYPTDTQFSIAKICLSILVLFSYPLQAFPCRSGLHSLIVHQLNLSAREDIRNSNWLRILEMTLILGSTYTLALFVDDLGIVFAVLGATGSPSICYILPAIFYLQMSSEYTIKQDWNRLTAYFLMAIGILITIVGNILNFL